MNQTLLIVLALVLLLVAFSVYYHFASSSKEKFEEPKLKVMLFYATWCPHCENYLKSGKWDSFSENKKWKSLNVEFAKYDYDQNHTLGDKYRVSSFPTIIAEDPSGKTTKFTGNRDSEEDMDSFIREALGK
jgi:thiol-disulfide isomerase/thioredoxin